MIALNKRGIKPDTLAVETGQEPVRKEFEDVVGQDSVTRFDKKNRQNQNNNRKKKKRPGADAAVQNGESNQNQAGNARGGNNSSALDSAVRPNPNSGEKNFRQNNNRRNNNPRRDNNRRSNENNPDKDTSRQKPASDKNE